MLFLLDGTIKALSQKFKDRLLLVEWPSTLVKKIVHYNPGSNDGLVRLKTVDFRKVRWI